MARARNLQFLRFSLHRRLSLWLAGKGSFSREFPSSLLFNYEDFVASFEVVWKIIIFRKFEYLVDVKELD